MIAVGGPLGGGLGTLVSDLRPAATVRLGGGVPDEVLSQMYAAGRLAESASAEVRAFAARDYLRDRRLVGMIAIALGEKP